MFPLGNWRNFEELEECLTVKEVFLLLESQRELRENERKFLAALQGVDLGGKSHWEYNPDNPDISTDTSGMFGYTEE